MAKTEIHIDGRHAPTRSPQRKMLGPSISIAKYEIYVGVATTTPVHVAPATLSVQQLAAVQERDLLIAGYQALGAEALELAAWALPAAVEALPHE